MLKMALKDDKCEFQCDGSGTLWARHCGQVGMVLGLEKLLGQCDLAVLPEIRRCNIAAQMIWNRVFERFIFTR